MSIAPRLWVGRGQANGDPRRSPDSAAGTDDRPSATESDEAAVATCYTKRTLARFLGVSVRTLARAAAVGLLPQPDLVVGNSPRWTPATVEKWLRTHPRLPGRGKRGGA